MSAKRTSKKNSTATKKTKAVTSKPDGLQSEPNDQDIKRRLGNFRGAGEPSRKGGRKGIGGQTSKQFKTDKKP